MNITINRVPFEHGLPIGYPPGIPQNILAKAETICGNLPYEACNAKIIALGFMHEKNVPVIIPIGRFALDVGELFLKYGGMYLHGVAHDTALWWNSF